jgi:hypothetical protein
MPRLGRRTGVSAETVAALLGRSDVRCEVCGEALAGERGVGWSVHHRRPRGMGGSRRADTHSIVNLLALCGSGTTGCHGRIESDRATALVCGWLVRSSADPAQIPVWLRHRGELVLLTADGDYEAAS